MNKMYAKETLPQGYAEAEKIDLVKNKKQMLLVNGLAIALAILVGILGIWLQPEGASSLFNIEENPLQTALQYLVVLGGIIGYIIGHEAVHGVCMWHYSHIKPNFGFSFTYAYAGSEVYFGKSAYLIIALAPVVSWFVVLGLLTLFLPASWFWVAWFLQIMNISGAAGDFYVFVRILRMADEVIVQDTGTAMTVFLPQA